MKIILEFWSETPFGKKIIKLIEEEDQSSGVGQQKLVDETDKDDVGDESVVLASPKQKALMDKHRIPYTDSTSKVEATRLISDFFESKKKKEG